MIINWQRDSGIMTYRDMFVTCLCSVRNELNKQRALTEACVFTETKNGSKGVAYMPRPFPKGSWTVLTILPKTDPYMAPWFIATDAHQLVDEWTMLNGHYEYNTGFQVEDYGYGLHNSTSSNTLGCGKIVGLASLLDLIKAIRTCHNDNEKVKLVVA